jgi:hypothetical protein
MIGYIRARAPIKLPVKVRSRPRGGTARLSGEHIAVTFQGRKTKLLYQVPRCLSTDAIWYVPQGPETMAPILRCKISSSVRRNPPDGGCSQWCHTVSFIRTLSDIQDRSTYGRAILGSLRSNQLPPDCHQTFPIPSQIATADQ